MRLKSSSALDTLSDKLKPAMNWYLLQFFLSVLVSELHVDDLPL